MIDDLVSVIIVNYNGERYLDDCLRSLRQQTLPRHRYEVIVIDNGSMDRSCDLIRQRYPEVRLVAARKNLGFAAGNNLGIAHAHGRAVVLLNNDTVADPHWLEQLVTHSRPGHTATSKLVFHDSPHVINSAGLRLLRDGRGKDLGFREEDRGQFEEARYVFGGCGAGLMIPVDGNDPRLLDEHFFMYYEDLDLAWSECLRGRACVYVPSAVLRHVHCGSSGEGSPFFCFQVERNRVLSALKNGDIFLVIFSVLGQWARVFRAGLRWLVARGDGQSFARFRAHVRAWWSFVCRLPTYAMKRYSQRRGWA